MRPALDRLRDLVTQGEVGSIYIQCPDRLASGAKLVLLVEEFLVKANAGWPLVQKLIAEGKLAAVECEGESFYIRRLPRKPVNEPIT